MHLQYLLGMLRSSLQYHLGDRKHDDRHPVLDMLHVDCYPVPVFLFHSVQRGGLGMSTHHSFWLDHKVVAWFLNTGLLHGVRVFTADAFMPSGGVEEET